MTFIEEILREQLGLSADLAALLIVFGGVLVVATGGLLTPIITIWLERKVAARFQDRIGPNRVGPLGLLQTIADVLKLLSKEQITPRDADKVVFFLAPILMVVSVVTMFAVIPFSPLAIGADLSIGILYAIAVSSLGTIAILMGGWGSNNKYALLGAFRVIAQLLSYEVPMILALLVPVLLAGTMSMQGITEAQANIWFVFFVPVAAVVFFISSTAEVGRQPFDLLEAESEIVAGYNIEYSGMQFAMFYLGEWLHAVVICLLTAILFLGGWQGPLVNADNVIGPILGMVYLIAKTTLLYFVHMWIRFTVPRLRIDHLMAFNWKFLVPLSVFNMLIVAFIWKLFPAPEEPGFVAELPRALGVLVGNIALVAVTLSLLQGYATRERQKVEGLVDETLYDPRAPRVAASATD
ncbi:MAG: NADH-quinone oxidoreductase subunit NuoH [Anaerolineae bacterium]|nr:NADH-quinone oxidoreductase subunit NuoH [Anaerolineae bacterium]